VKPVITPAEAARLDATGDIPVLMERAGLAVALAAVGLGAQYGSTVAVLAGPGNNGGDGSVAARILHRRGVGVTLYLLAEPVTDPARQALARARQAGVTVRALGPPRPVDLVIDALFGGGYRPGLEPAVEAWFGTTAPVLAVDVPTGLDPLDGTVARAAFTATRTVTFHALRTGHLLGDGPDRCGLVTVADIGLQGGEPELLLAESIDTIRPPRLRVSHKWSAGSVLCVGGSVGMVGAAILVARSALGFGAGAAGVAVPDVGLAQTAGPDVLAYPLRQVPERYGILVVGPGLGDLAPEVAPGYLDDPRPVVFDADALGAVTSEQLSTRSGPTVLTPHAGEFRRLAGSEPDPVAARALAGSTGAVVLLKGNPTIVTDGGTPWVVTSGGPELATIGSGDVLAGMIGALLARGVDPLRAAVSAAYWHGVAGADLAREGTITANRLAAHIGRFAWQEAA
jgi:ADP-dependent NAD(P)H-hydrate dehydratase / NAD(P)H-hydrate epimerase